MSSINKKVSRVSLGIDIGSSAVKASLVDVESGNIIVSAVSPENGELDILSPYSGWAEQDPETWWENVKNACLTLRSKVPQAYSVIEVIGLSFQEHGLVLMDKNDKVLRPSIIWCDSRAIAEGEKLVENNGREKWFVETANLPGNFTFSKLAWVRRHEQDIYENIKTIFLPGDYIAFRFTNEKAITREGLSEGMFYSFSRKRTAEELLSENLIDSAFLPKTIESFSFQGKVTKEIAKKFGFSKQPSVTFRAGDQHANAVGMDVTNPGFSALGSGTSGVIFAVTDKTIVDTSSRVNTFLHVTEKNHDDRYVVVLCINAVGIVYSWLRKVFSFNGKELLSYKLIDESAEKVEAFTDGVYTIPFGNGAERMLGNRSPGYSVYGIDFNRHSPSVLARSGLEGIAFSFYYGYKVFQELDLTIKVLRSGASGLCKSRFFRKMLASMLNIPIEVYDSDPAYGAAVGAMAGAGIYDDLSDFLRERECLTYDDPDVSLHKRLEEGFENWNTLLNKGQR